MNYDANTPVVNVAPRMSKAAFVAWLQSVKSPAADTASAGYDAIVANRVDPLFCAACFWHESNAATNPSAIVVQYQTNNPGNCRTSRTGSGTVVNTPRGQFVKYPNWYEGWRDLAFRLVDPTYVYAQGGCTTPGKIVPKFAPESDGNDPNGYLQSVLTFMNQHADLGGGEQSVATADDSAATWQPSSNFDAGRGGVTIDRIILHTTEGGYLGSLHWLQGQPASSNTDSSAHYIVDANGGQLAQLVREADTAWAAGVYSWNQRSINIEQEGFAAKGGFSDGLYQTVGALVGRIARRHNIPLDRQHVIGHMDVPPPNNHTDPGPHYDFDRVLAVAKGGQSASSQTTPAAPDVYVDPVTGYTIAHGMLARWNQLKAALASISADEILLVVGHPVGNERVDPDGVTRQDFEHETWEWRPGQAPDRFDILVTIAHPFVAGGQP